MRQAGGPWRTSVSSMLSNYSIFCVFSSWFLLWDMLFSVCSSRDVHKYIRCVVFKILFLITACISTTSFWLMRCKQNCESQDVGSICILVLRQLELVASFSIWYNLNWWIGCATVATDWSGTVKRNAKKKRSTFFNEMICRENIFCGISLQIGGRVSRSLGTGGWPFLNTEQTWNKNVSWLDVCMRFLSLWAEEANKKC